MSEANRSGIIETISKMEWYIGLSRLTYDPGDGGPDDATTAGSSHPREMLTELYESILLFTIAQSVASIKHRHYPEHFSHDSDARQRISKTEVALFRQLG